MADWLGVPRHTLSAMFGVVIARGEGYRETFQAFRPGFDLDEERERRAHAGRRGTFGEEDLYPDPRTTLGALREAGLWVGIAGNQTVRAGGILRSLCELIRGAAHMAGRRVGWRTAPSPGCAGHRVFQEKRTPCPARRR